MASKRFLTLASLCALALVAGCGSSTQSPTVIDTAPPAVPTGLWVAGGPNAVTVTWDPNLTDADFVGFRLARVVNGDDARLMDDPEDVTEYVDTAPVLGVTSVYQVTAVDASGNESAYATIDITLGLRHGDRTPSAGPDADGTITSRDTTPRTQEYDRHQH